MSHILFMTSNLSVCERPNQLGYDWVMVDYSGGRVCMDCTRLLVAHNAKADKYELTLATIPSVKKGPEPSQESNFVNGAIFATAFWLAAALTAWFIFFK